MKLKAFRSQVQGRRARQSGLTLVITLIMMLIVGVVALSSLGGSERNLQIAGQVIALR